MSGPWERALCACHGRRRKARLWHISKPDNTEPDHSMVVLDCYDDPWYFHGSPDLWMSPASADTPERVRSWPDLVDDFGALIDTCPNQWPPRTVRPCCDLHNRNCEPPSELCCWECAEVDHPEHRGGTACVLATQ